jgi:dTDP-4-dehydrorhamnose 3,5-epimerase
MSIKGTLRGLHFQKDPYEQGKLVRVVYGEVFDVVVDIRKKSPTFLKWFGLYLSEENKRQLWIPCGFAHGFMVTSDKAEFLYKTTEYYQPDFEETILWNDPTLNIDWPDIKKIISPKDLNGKKINDIFL